MRAPHWHQSRGIGTHPHAVERLVPGGDVPLGPAVAVTGVVLEQARMRSLNAAGGSSPTFRYIATTPAKKPAMLVPLQNTCRSALNHLPGVVSHVIP